MWPSLATVALVLGAAVRIEQYLFRRSLWLDEALLAVNVDRLGFGDLFGALPNGQAAPPLFLWAERAVTNLAGDSEYALRALPLLAGLATLVVGYRLATRLLPPAGATAAAVLLAASPGLVRYSTEVKQYSVDALVATVLVLFAIGARHRSLAVVGAVALWTSHSAVLVLAGVALAVAVPHLARRRLPPRDVVVMLGTWAASAATVWAVSLRHVAADSRLNHYWEAGFLPEGSSPVSAAAWATGAARDLFADPARIGLPTVAALLALLGVLRLSRHDSRAGAVLLLPAVVALAAAVAGRYPFEGRLVLFLVPTAIVLVAAALPGDAAGRAVVGVALLACAVAPVRETARAARHPVTFAESRPLFEHLREHRRPGDLLVLHELAEAPWRWYGPKLGVDAGWLVRWAVPSECNDVGPQPSLLPPGASGRIWLLQAYQPSTRPADDFAAARSAFAALGRQSVRLDRPGATLRAYDLGAVDVAAVRGIAGLPCLVGGPVPPDPLDRVAGRG